MKCFLDRRGDFGPFSGVPKPSSAGWRRVVDYKEAVNWYRLAAEQEYASAQYNLGGMHARGLGAPQDYVQAHTWFNLAGASGAASGINNRDIIARRMTPEQIAQAQVLLGSGSRKRAGKIVRPQNKMIYFDTSAWNHLEKDPDREHLIGLIQRSKLRVLASVISVGEVLRIKEEPLRKRICSVMRALHGDGPLLERSFSEFARAAAQGVLQGQGDFLLPETGPGKSLRACMLRLRMKSRAGCITWMKT